MNRPEFLLRHFEFSELMNSPHPIYVSDSSNEENAEKIKRGIKRFKKLSIVYEWVPPGKDHLYSLFPLIKEKYCIQVGDDDLIIPKTISECADFLENNSDYGTCAGKQVNFNFRQEDYIKPHGLIARQTLPLGRSFEEEDMLVRAKIFWSGTYFTCFAVRRTETERSIRNITKYSALAGRITEISIWSILIISGKSKILNKLGYVMQQSDIRSFPTELTADFMLAPSTKGKLDICQNGLSKFLQGKGVSHEESLKISEWLLILYLARQFSQEANYSFPYPKSIKSLPLKQNLSKKIRYLALSYPFFKKIYYKFKIPDDVTRPESKYFNDFKIIKDFLEESR